MKAYVWIFTVYVPNAISGIVEFGTTLTFAPAQISDVLTPYLQSAYSLYVLGPNNEYVISQSGTLLDGTQNLRETYAITLNAYGTYTVIYEYRDQFGNPSENIIVLYVNDRIAPQISLANGYGSNTTVQAKLGEKITVADYTVSDNFGQENVTVVVRALSPNNELFLLDGRTFNAKEKGTWKILYYAMDAEGNYVTAYYTIHVA